MKKTVSILLVLLMLASLFAACSAPQTPSQPQETAAPTEPEPEGIFVSYNGANISVDMPFAEIKDKLGAETQPSETIGSCDENSDWQQTMHYYDGMIVTEDKDGVIDGVQVSEGEAASLMGKLKIGATKDDVRALLGEPDTDAEWGMYYQSTTPWVNFYFEEGANEINGFALMRGMEG